MADGVAALREQVTTLTVAKLAELNRAFPGLVMPRTFAGHPVDDQSSAHLLKAMSLLVSIGVDEIDGLDLRRRALEMADATDPSITGFASFSFGESIVGLGGLDAVADPERALAAVRDPELNRRLLEDDRPPPPNFNLVAARCLFEEHALTGHEPALLTPSSTAAPCCCINATPDGSTTCPIRSCTSTCTRPTCTSSPPHCATCLLYTSPSPRDKRQSRMPSSA